MKKTIAMHEERDKKHKADDGQQGSAVPAYLLEREQVRHHCCGALVDWLVDCCEGQQGSAYLLEREQVRDQLVVPGVHGRCILLACCSSRAACLLVCRACGATAGRKLRCASWAQAARMNYPWSSVASPSFTPSPCAGGARQGAQQHHQAEA